MSQGRAVGLVLATVCGVLTAYSSLGPELQKQQAERNGEFNQQHVNTAESVTTIPSPIELKGEVQPPNQTVISNDESIGKSVKDAVQQSTNEEVAEKSWPGLGILKWSFGGASSPKADASKELGKEGLVQKKENDRT